MSRIFWVTKKVAGMVQSDGILNFFTCTSNGSACNFKYTKIRLMYGSCAAYVYLYS